MVAMTQAAATLDLSRAEEECGTSAAELLRRQYEALPPGAVLEVRSTVGEHAFLVRAWAARAGAEMVGDVVVGREHILRVQRPPL